MEPHIFLYFSYDKHKTFIFIFKEFLCKEKDWMSVNFREM